MQKFFLFSLFGCLLFSSCAKPSQWATSHIKSSSKEFSSSRLSYFSRDKVNELDLEFLKSNEGIRLFLIVHSHPILPLHDDPKHAQVIIKTEDTKQEFIAYRLKGGQRLLLDENAQNLIFQLLKEKKPLSIEVLGYRTEISAFKFQEAFQSFNHPFPISLPFHLPF